MSWFMIYDTCSSSVHGGEDGKGGENGDGPAHCDAGEEDGEHEELHGEDQEQRHCCHSSKPW